MTTAVVTQPTYLPWLGYFEMIARADVFVFLDTAQFQKRSWHSRNRLRGSDGQPFWMSVPVVAAPRNTPLRDIEVAPPSEGWSDRHLRSLEMALGAAPYGSAALEAVTPVLADPPSALVDLNIALVRSIADALELTPTWIRASDLDIESTRSQRLVDICRTVGADAYHSAAGSRDYMDEDAAIWEASGLDVGFQEWDHPSYPQHGFSDFMSHLSALDAVANLGAAATTELLTPELLR